MHKSTKFLTFSILVWFVTHNVFFWVIQYKVHTHGEMIESLQRRLPATFKNDFSEHKLSGNLLLGPQFKYENSEAQNDIAYRKHICEELGGTYREDFNTDQHDDGISGYNGLREGAVYECSRVEPIFLAN